jgi:hypothetical protein
MTKTLSLAASMMPLLAISGPALARDEAPNAPHWHTMAAPADRQTPQAYGSFDQTTIMQTAEPNTHRYEGGPKSND